ncbi:MAG: hypothetical protein SGI73_12985 [Chloroflexota bacterium]|nr:hypothetical protein [Chloroflexota bacterium]
MRRITRSILAVWTIFALLLLSACASETLFAPQPSARYARGEVLAEVDFSQPTDWENYADPALGVDFRVEDDAYRAQIDARRLPRGDADAYATGVNAASARAGGFMWTLHPAQHSNSLIQVDTLPYSIYRDNAYGVMCRASPDDNGDGYYFLISADGQYTIRRGFNREIQPLIEWTASSAIRQDTAPNRLRALCLGDRLALYINGQFVAETRDSLYRQGSAGIVAAVPAGGELDVQFDQVIIWAASD